MLAAISMLALGHESSGDTQNALAYYSRGLQIDPNNEALLLARGMLLYGASPRAAADFELAIQVGSREVWPYFFLAHYYVLNNRFDECRSMCERGLRKPAPPSVKSALFEWLAISQAELNYPAEVVRASLENALRADPTSDTARRNVTTFEESLALHPHPTRNWERRSASVLRTFGQQESRKSNGFSGHRELAQV